MLMVGSAANGFTSLSTYSLLPGTWKPGPQSHCRIVRRSSGGTDSSETDGALSASTCSGRDLSSGEAAGWPRKRDRILAKSEVLKPASAMLSPILPQPYLTPQDQGMAARHSPGTAAMARTDGLAPAPIERPFRNCLMLRVAWRKR